jgi:cell division protein FtsZ
MGLAMMGTGIAEGNDRAVEAARRAISSPLLEGASVTGARGVIINITGGPDLSLVEVSEASCIVQEAAAEDANIIFGAVVDPVLTGKVKITVIATGFGPPAATRPVAPSLQTPVDMTMYTEQTRARSEPAFVAAASVDRLATPRLTIARRPLIDLPPGVSIRPASPTMDVPAEMQAVSAREGGEASPDPDFDLGPTFDVPAFLRRQEN